MVGLDRVVVSQSLKLSLNSINDKDVSQLYTSKNGAYLQVPVPKFDFPGKVELEWWKGLPGFQRNTGMTFSNTEVIY